jgi:hypothetical protein
VSPEVRKYSILATDKSIVSAWECGKMSLHCQEEMLEIHMDEK